MSFPNDEFRSAFLSIIMEAQLGLGGREVSDQVEGAKGK